MNIRNFMLPFCLLAMGLFPVSGVSANDVALADQEAWLKTIHESWAEEDSEFKNSPTSPLAGVSRFEISEVEAVHFSIRDGQLGWSPEKTAQPVFSLTNIVDGWKWIGQEDISVKRGEESVQPGSLLATGDNLRVERFTVSFYPSADKITALVFDPETQRIKEFETLERFEPDPRFAVTAKIVKFESPEQLDLVTGLQRFKKQYRYARLHFEIGGTPLELTAYKYALEGDGSGYFFIPFTDKTTGKHSYGGGRYLFVDEPSESDKVQFDFNLATNPLCSYAAIYNCIVPTRENKLPIAILAGVKKYDYKH